MTTSTTTILKPNVTLAAATRALKGPLREFRRGRLAMVLDFYVPYRIFQLTLTNDNKTAGQFLGIDAVTGALDPYAFDYLPAKDERRIISSDRICKTAISDVCALEIAEERIKRGLYTRGFFKIKDPQVKGVYLETLHIPYWIGLYRREDQVTIEVLNAVRGLYEGAKVREIIAGWFASSRNRKVETNA